MSGIASPTGSSVSAGRNARITLTNFDENRKNPPYLNSPRSLDACDRQGVRPEELLFRPMQSFSEKGVPDEVVRMRWEHHESKRKEKLVLVRNEYRSIVAEFSGSQKSFKDDQGNMLSQRSMTSSKQAEEEKLNENMRKAMETMKRNMKEEVGFRFHASKVPRSLTSLDRLSKFF
jgi:hypothetical protein